MPVQLSASDAKALLQELNDKFGERTYLEHGTKKMEIKVPFGTAQLKAGRAVDGTWKLKGNESDDEFASRKEEEETTKKDLMTQYGMQLASIKGHIKREFVVELVKKLKVSEMITELSEKIDCHQTKTKLFLSKTDIAAIIIDFLKYGSEADEAFLCDKIIQSNTDFFYPNQFYYGNEFIQDLLTRYSLLGDNINKPVSKVLYELVAGQQDCEHLLLLAKLEEIGIDYKHTPNNDAVQILIASGAFHENTLYGYLIETSKPTSSIEDFCEFSVNGNTYLEETYATAGTTAKQELADAEKTKGVGGFFSKMFN